MHLHRGTKEKNIRIHLQNPLRISNQPYNNPNNPNNPTESPPYSPTESAPSVHTFVCPQRRPLYVPVRAIARTPPGNGRAHTGRSLLHARTCPYRSIPATADFSLRPAPPGGAPFPKGG